MTNTAPLGRPASSASRPEPRPPPSTRVSAGARVKARGAGRRARSHKLAKGNDHGRSQELELAKVWGPRPGQEGCHAGHRPSAGPAELTQRPGPDAQAHQLERGGT